MSADNWAEWAQAALVGAYLHFPEENDWHHVTISLVWHNERPELLWSNRAGVSWSLAPTADFRYLAVGNECPYYNDGHTQCEITTESDARVLVGPWGEPYYRVPEKNAKRHEDVAATRVQAAVRGRGARRKVRRADAAATR
eukprot:6268732-Prymnesium_polylepis.1